MALKGKQKNIDMNKNNKIDAEDFALLKKKKEGRPMKAKRGKFNDLQKFAKGKGLPAPLTGAAGSGFGKMAGNFPAIKTAPGSMASKAEAVSKMKSAKELTKEAGKKFLKRRMGVGAALATGVLAAGKAAKAFKDKKAAQKRDTAKVKKMGGGMMKRPMGYRKGSPENPMKEERFQQTSQAAIAKAIGKENVGDPRKVERPSKKNRLTESDIKKAKDTVMEGSKVAASRVSPRMGGGMMQRPMGMGMTKKGKMIKARGGGMARTKPTSMYQEGQCPQTNYSGWDVDC